MNGENRDFSSSGSQSVGRDISKNAEVVSEFREWARQVDDFLHDFTGMPSGNMPDDPRFEWWAWFQSGLTPEGAASAAIDIITGSEFVHYAQS